MSFVWSPKISLDIRWKWLWWLWWCHQLWDFEKYLNLLPHHSQLTQQSVERCRGKTPLLHIFRSDAAASKTPFPQHCPSISDFHSCYQDEDSSLWVRKLNGNHRVLVLFVLFGGLGVAFGMSREVECRKGIRVLAAGSQTVTGCILGKTCLYLNLLQWIIIQCRVLLTMLTQCSMYCTIP